MEGYSYSITIDFDEKNQISKTLGNTEYWIGRSGECDIILPNAKVSRKHAKLILVPPTEMSGHSYYLIRDNQSSNGTWVKGRLIKDHNHLKKRNDYILVLQDNDEITFGSRYPIITLKLNIESNNVSEEPETSAQEYLLTDN